jgi:hydroxymethylbilane synthase
VVAERSTLAALEAGCSAPVAAYAEVADGEDGPELFLRASVTALDGSDAVRGSLTGPLGEAAALGRSLAAELLDRGAAALMAPPQIPEHAPSEGPGSRSTR